MPRLDYRRCRNCGRNARDVGPLSHTRLCGECGTEELTANVVQMVAHTGPNWTRWRRSMAACVGGVLVDDLREGT